MYKKHFARLTFSVYVPVCGSRESHSSRDRYRRICMSIFIEPINWYINFAAHAYRISLFLTRVLLISVCCFLTGKITQSHASCRKRWVKMILEYLSRGSLTRRNKIRVAVHETPCLCFQRCVTVKRKESTAILRSRAIFISSFFYIGNFLLLRIRRSTLETCGFWKTRARVDPCVPPATRSCWMRLVSWNFGESSTMSFESTNSKWQISNDKLTK